MANMTSKNSGRETEYIDNVFDYLSGVRAPDGALGFEFGHDDAPVRISRNVLLRTPKVAFQQMVEAGLPPADAAAVKRILKAAGKITKFMPKPLLFNHGATGSYFVSAGGAVFSPKGEPAGICVPEPEPSKGVFSGTVEDWQAQIVAPAEGNPLLGLAIMMPFAGPLMPHIETVRNIGVAFCGGEDADTTVLVQAALSVWGGAFGQAAGQYGVHLDETGSTINVALHLHNDQFLAIDGASRYCYNPSDKIRREKLHVLNNRLGTGQVLAADGRTMTRRRCVWAMSADTVGKDLIGGDFGDGGDFDGLLRLPVKRRHGAFDKVPPPYDGPGDFAAALASAIGRHYGTAIEHYLQYVVDAVHKDQRAFRKRVDKLCSKFRKRVGASKKTDLARKIADVFSLFYAAGTLAKCAGVLPADIKCLSPAAKCYRLCLREMQPPKTPVERLMDLAKAKGVIDFRVAKRRSMSTAKLCAVPAFLDVTGAGELEIMITSQGMARWASDWKSILKDPEVARLMRPDVGQNKPKCSLRKGIRDRAYCFTLGPVEQVAAQLEGSAKGDIEPKAADGQTKKGHEGRPVVERERSALKAKRKKVSGRAGRRATPQRPKRKSKGKKAA